MCNVPLARKRTVTGSSGCGRRKLPPALRCRVPSPSGSNRGRSRQGQSITRSASDAWLFTHHSCPLKRLISPSPERSRGAASSLASATSSQSRVSIARDGINAPCAASHLRRSAARRTALIASSGAIASAPSSETRDDSSSASSSSRSCSCSAHSVALREVACAKWGQRCVNRGTTRRRRKLRS